MSRSQALLAVLLAALLAGILWLARERLEPACEIPGPDESGALARMSESGTRSAIEEPGAYDEAAERTARDESVAPMTPAPDVSTATPAITQQIPIKLVEGTVVDEDGEPCSAHVTLVGVPGSLGLETLGGGRFRSGFDADSLLFWSAGEVTLYATTDDGRAAILGGVDRMEDIDNVELVLHQGATVTLALEGIHDGLRCRLLHDGIIIEDFTLRKGTPARRVVPAGPLLVQAYTRSGKDMLILDEHSLRLAKDQDVDVAVLVER